MPAPQTLRPGPDKRPWSCARIGCPAPTHDQTNGYRYGCRSWLAVIDEARRCAAVRAGTWEPRLVSRVGLVRRLRALSAAGWTSHEVARRLGRSVRTVERWRRSQNPSTTTRVLDEVKELYDELWCDPGPCNISRAHARRYGWPEPWQWEDVDIDDPAARPTLALPATGAVDDVAVDHAVGGHLELVRLARPEQDAVVRVLRGHVDPEDACRRLRCSREDYRIAVERVAAQDKRAAARARVEGSEAA